MKISVCRKEQFNAAHRLYNPDWAEEKNEKVFGKCNNPNFHGHNYELIVKVIGDPDPDTGYVYDLKELSDLIIFKIIAKFTILIPPHSKQSTIHLQIKAVTETSGNGFYIAIYKHGTVAINECAIS